MQLTNTKLAIRQMREESDASLSEMKKEINVLHITVMAFTRCDTPTHDQGHCSTHTYRYLCSTSSTTSCARQFVMVVALWTVAISIQASFSNSLDLYATVRGVSVYVQSKMVKGGF